VYFTRNWHTHAPCPSHIISSVTFSDFLRNGFLLTGINPGDIDLRLSISKLVFIRDMIALTEQAECSDQTIINILPQF
jgi:hypothetical protein